MTSKKTYFNSYLENALKRKEENRQNFKDLYYTEYLRIKKELSCDVKEIGQSLFDVILFSYKKTRENKDRNFTLYISLNNLYSNGNIAYEYIINNRDIVLASLSLFNIKQFKIEINKFDKFTKIESSYLKNEFDFAMFRQYKKEKLIKEYESEHYTLGKDIVLFNKNSEVFEIKDKIEYRNIL